MQIIKPKFLLALIACISSATALAHHSFATFDMSRTVRLAGTVQKVEWANPHLWLWFVVTDESGGGTIWGVEGGPVSLYARAGWKPNTFKPGDKVEIELHPLKSGEAAGSLSRIWMDGKELPVRRERSEEQAR